MKPFELGNLVATPAAIELMMEHGVDPLVLIQRHLGGDFGDLGEGDRKRNEEATETGSRVFSSYQIGGQNKVWIITEAEDDGGRRQSTCILLPSEY